MIVAAVVLLLAGSVAALLVFLGDDDYRRIATYLVERATGREVAIEGQFSFHASLEPSLTASDVRVANAPSAPQPDLARIGHLEVQLALRPLLSGRLLIPRLILEDADFELEKGADGTTDWATALPRGRLVPVLGTVALRNVAWHYRDRATGRQTSIALGHLTLEDQGNVARLDGQGTWDGQKIGAKGEFGTLAQALDPTKPFALDLSVSLPALELSLRGTMADPVAGRGLDLRLSGQSDNIGQLLTMLGSDLPLAGRLEGEANLSGDFAALRLSALQLGVVDDQSSEPKPNLEMTGQIETVRPGAAVPLEGIDCKVQLATSTAALSGWLRREVPDLGRVQGRFALTGSSQALKLADLDLRVGSADRLMVGARGVIDEIKLAPDLGVQGVDLRVEVKATASAPLAKILDRPLPELGPLEGRFVLTGSAEALKLGDLDLRIGSVDQLSIVAAGAVDDIRLRPDPAVRGVEVGLEATAPSTAALANALGRRLPELGALRASGRLTGGLDRLDLEGVDLRAGPPERPVRVTGRIDNVLFLGAGRASATFDSNFGALLGWALDRELPALGPVRARAELANIDGGLRIEGLEATAGDTDVLSARVAGILGDARSRDRSGLDIELAARDLTILGTMLDVSIPALGPFSFKGRLEGDLETPRLSGKARLGQTDIDENLRVPRLPGRGLGSRVNSPRRCSTLTISASGRMAPGRRTRRRMARRPDRARSRPRSPPCAGWT